MCCLVHLAVEHAFATATSNQTCSVQVWVRGVLPDIDLIVQLSGGQDLKRQVSALTVVTLRLEGRSHLLLPGLLSSVSKTVMIPREATTTKR